MEGFQIPNFSLSQDANQIYIHIACQGVTGAGATPNIAVEGRIFGFHLEPYYLPLVLPGAVTRPASAAELVQGIAQESALGSTQFLVTLNKAQPGEDFEELDTLQPQLLPEDELKQALADAEQQKGFFQPSGVGPSENAGAEVGEDEAAKALLQQALRNQGLTTVNDDDGEATIDMRTSTAGIQGFSKGKNGKSFGFGFRATFTGSLIPAGCADTRNVLEVSDPEATEPAKREQAALEFEEKRWDEGIYMDNYLDIDGELAHLLRYQPSIPAASTSNVAVPVGNADVELLALILQLLFAHSYDDRTNEGDPTVESGWTIAKLSRSLAASSLPQSSTSASTCLEDVVASTLIGCMRRSLTVPLYRHWELGLACIHDALRRIEAGTEHVFNSLDQVATRMEEGQDAILCRLSQVWIAPMLAQPPNAAQLNQLSTAMRTVMQKGDVVTKEAVGGDKWDLEVLEQAAKEALEDGEGGFV